MGLVAPWHVGSSRTRARTCVPCIGRWILNHCAPGKSQFICFLKKLNYLFICLFICLCLVFVVVRGLSLVADSGGYSLLRCAGFSWWLLLLRSVGSRCAGFSSCDVRASVVVAHWLSSCGLRALEHRLSSCSARALFLCGMWDLPGPGLEPVSPALAGGFLTTAHQGSPNLSVSDEAL